MNFVAPLFLILVATGLPFAVIGGIFWKYPPKTINYWYGYRTKRSMQSQQFWDFAQVYSSRIMVLVGLALCIVAVPGLFIPLPEWLGVGLSLLIILLAAYAVFYLTEKALKQRFSNDAD